MTLVAKKTWLTLVLLLPVLMNPASADEALLLERIERLERIIQGQGLISLLGRVDQVQNEIQRLNGENESLRHELEQMQRRQRELYLDLDQRLQAQTNTMQIPQTPTGLSAPPMSDDQPIVATPNAPQQQPAEHADDTLLESSPVAVENGEAAYQAALQTLRSGQYEQAIKALAAFPEQYPSSSYLPNTYYWQGEANYVLRNFDLAIEAFQKVIAQFPASSKVADARLKLGFSQYELGQIDTAKTTLALVIDQYPNSSAARLAKVRLDRINQQAAP